MCSYLFEFLRTAINAYFLFALLRICLSYVCGDSSLLSNLSVLLHVMESFLQQDLQWGNAFPMGFLKDLF